MASSPEAAEQGLSGKSGTAAGSSPGKQPKSSKTGPLPGLSPTRALLRGQVSHETIEIVYFDPLKLHGRPRPRTPLGKRQPGSSTAGSPLGVAGTKAAVHLPTTPGVPVYGNIYGLPHTSVLPALPPFEAASGISPGPAVGSSSARRGTSSSSLALSPIAAAPPHRLRPLGEISEGNLSGTPSYDRAAREAMLRGQVPTPRLARQLELSATLQRQWEASQAALQASVGRMKQLYALEAAQEAEYRDVVLEERHARFRLLEQYQKAEVDARLSQLSSGVQELFSDAARRQAIVLARELASEVQNRLADLQLMEFSHRNVLRSTEHQRWGEIAVEFQIEVAWLNSKNAKLSYVFTAEDSARRTLALRAASE
eukprot:RCo009427